MELFSCRCDEESMPSATALRSCKGSSAHWRGNSKDYRDANRQLANVGVQLRSPETFKYSHINNLFYLEGLFLCNTWDVRFWVGWLLGFSQ